MSDIITEEDFPIKQMRRAEKLEKKRRAIPKHAKFLGEIYAEVWRKRSKINERGPRITGEDSFSR